MNHEMLPPAPPALKRECTADYQVSAVWPQVETDDEQRTRYLQCDVAYRACKYPEAMTWGQLFTKDYPHFVELLTFHVGVHTKIFHAFISLLSPADQEKARTATRFRDTLEGQAGRLDHYLSLECSHKGKMNGKTWRWIRDNNYGYYLWSVGNAMGRDTRSFSALFEGLRDGDKTMVQNTPKGSVMANQRKVVKSGTA